MSRKHLDHLTDVARSSLENPRQPVPPTEKPLSRVQAYLVESKTCVILLREILEEFKGLLVIVVLLAVFILEAIHLIFK